MKYRIVLVTSVIITLVVVLLSYTYAHPGSTDSRGGHYDRSTGEYHYHHGYPAHQHYDGECSYDFDDKTDHSSSSNNNSSNKNIQQTKDTATFGDILVIILIKIVLFIPIFVGVCLFSTIPLCIFGKILDKLNDNTAKLFDIIHMIFCVIVTIVILFFIN